MGYLTTGQAAKLLMVTRDTVLKWIKQGMLSAVKTEGGHYRIPLECLQSSKIAKGGISSNEKLLHRQPESMPYCWEYYSSEGNVREECRSCLTFKVRGTKCYELAEFLRKTGFGATCCPTSCELCPYFIENSKKYMKVLIFTEDGKFRDLISKQFQFSSLDFRFASWDYECSFIIESFRPQYVIIDSQAGRDKYERLRWHLTKDPRIPGVKVALAGSFTERVEESDNEGTSSPKTEHPKFDLKSDLKNLQVKMQEHRPV